MIRRLALAASLLALAHPARADFASCVSGLKSEAAKAGVSSETLNAAFAGLEPDMKVLEFENYQPEFKTPIWDYMAALVDDERVADGKKAMAEHAAPHIAAGGRLSHVTRHMVGLFHGMPGARRWRQVLSTDATRPGAGPEVLWRALGEVDLAGKNRAA